MAKKLKGTDVLKSVQKNKRKIKTPILSLKKKHQRKNRKSFGMTDEFRGMFNNDSPVIKKAIIRSVGLLNKDGNSFLADKKDLKVFGSNKEWLRSSSNFQLVKSKDGLTVQERVRKSVEKETVPIYDRKTGEYKTVTRTKTQYTEKWKKVDDIIPFTKDEADKAFRNLGFEATRWIKQYGEKWKVHLAEHIIEFRANPENKESKKYGIFNEVEALKYLAYAKNKRSFQFGEFEMKKLYQNQYKFVGQDVPLYKAVSELLENNTIDAREVAAIHKHLQGHFKVPMWQYAYFNYQNLDTSKLTEMLGNPSDMPFVDNWTRSFMYRLGDQHRLHARSKGKKDPYFSSEGYDELLEYIEGNPDGVILHPNNVIALVTSDVFMERFFEYFDFTWGVRDAKEWIDTYLIQGQASLKNISFRAARAHIERKLKVFGRAWKDPKDGRLTHAIESVVKSVKGEGPTLIDKQKVDRELKWIERNVKKEIEKKSWDEVVKEFEEEYGDQGEYD